MKHLYNSNKYIIFFFIILFFSCDNSPLNSIDCSEYGLFEDDCGQCTQCDETCSCDLEVCDYNLGKDDCGVCFENNSSCTGCMNDIATNYNDYATISCADCCIYGDIFVVFSNEDGFEPILHQTATGIPIYWLNNSNQNILIQTENSPQPECKQVSESIYSNPNCDTYTTNQQCEVDNEGCFWDIPNGYDINWDVFQIEVPAGTSIMSQNQYYFSGFNSPSSGYTYYYQYGDNNDEIFYGYININE